MSLASTWVRLGGITPATELAPHSPPTWETLASGGSGEASFELGRSAKFAPHLTQPGSLMEIMVGPMRVWRGRVGDYDRASGQVVGRGIHTDGNSIPGLDGGGAATRVVQTAITTALAAPWSWPITRNGVAGTLLGDATEPMMVWPMIEALADETGARAYFDPDGALYVTADPTTPTWTIAPEAAAFGQTTEGQATRLVGRFLNIATGLNETTIRVAAGEVVARAEIVDLIDRRGAMTLAQANSILDAALAATKAKTGWVNAVTLHREQITRNGTPAYLPAIHARNRMVRAQGVPATFGDIQATWLDAVLGKTTYTAGEDTITLEPVDTAPRTLTDVLAAS